MLSKKVDIRWNLNPDQLKELVNLQCALLDHASRLLKVEGVLVYSTCSLEAEENENVVRRFLEKNRDFALIPRGEAGAGALDPFWCDDGFFRSYPHRHGTDGFFAARLTRRRQG